MMGLMAVGALTSCATDDDITDLQQEINKLKQQIGQEGGSPMIKLTGGEAGQTELSLFPGETLTVKVEAEKGITDLAASTTDTDWRVLCDEEKGELLITAPLVVRDTPAKVFVSGANAQGVMYRAGIVCRMRNYADPKAVLILNEGQVGTGEMGSMIYVNPKGVFGWDRYGVEELLQVQWVSALLHPDLFPNLKIEEKVKTFYKTYLNYSLTDDEVKLIMAGKDPQ